MYIYSYTYTHESKYNITYIFIAYGRIYYTNAHLFTLVTCIICITYQIGNLPYFQIGNQLTHT
ncbi:hypothetical protein F383_33153 [Gossypium arboreum]|uniref:Uncharacterized protein n=1 Tax=Gossypium arboreum TaxID=29729 RepID=A0A0B0N2Q5_GOSAR|nr:hypothetical protein F383_33153 [Gossypium arboreum]